jgi:outer membrane receptor for ferrienterochelin and colicin
LNNNFVRDISYTNGIESGIYVEDIWQPFHNLKINEGIRFSHFLATKNQYHNFEPRLSVAWRIKNNLALKVSYATMNQYIHLLSNTGIGLPTDLWVPTTDRIKPQQSQQVALGLVKDLTKHDLSISLEGYYKKMTNVIGYKEGATFIVFGDPKTAAEKNWEDNVTSGRAWSYGMEFLIQKKEGRLTGWIGYTLSWTPMQFDSLNFGKKFYARYDRRHDISIVVIYKVSNHITLSSTWVYGTGNAVTLPNSTYLIEANSPNIGPGSRIFYYNNYGILYSGFDYQLKNNFRMQPYHRLDLGIQFHKTKKWGQRIWEISIYNVYNRMNPFFYYSGTEYINNKTYGILKQVSLFPIIPSFSYSIKF